MTDTKKELQEQVNHIAKELTKTYNGERVAEYDEEYTDHDKGDLITLYDELIEPGAFLDIDIVTSPDDRNTIKGAFILVAFGGPNIRIDTYNSKIVGDWWTEHEEALLPNEVADEMNEIIQELCDSY